MINAKSGKNQRKKKKSNDNFLKIQNKTPFLKMANEKKIDKKHSTHQSPVSLHPVC
jgi:hypothetical protein